MSFRYMRVVVFFDLPTTNSKDLRIYRTFRKYLIKAGFLMMQESVYCKLAQNSVIADSIVENIKKNKPSQGIVQVLRVTEKQYSKMDFVVGERMDDIIDSTDRIIIL